MIEFIGLCAGLLVVVLKSRAALQAENLALRHQLCVYQRSVKKPKVKPADRILWSFLAKTWTGWKDALIFVKPDTVIRWQRVKNMGIEEVLAAPHSPWQNPYSERLNGSVRRECLDHVIVFS